MEEKIVGQGCDGESSCRIGLCRGCCQSGMYLLSVH